ncbi:MAG: M23 family metallopeptidase [Myxococcales bacterium]
MRQQLPRKLGAALRAAERTQARAKAYALAWPLPPETRLSSRFGPRRHPVLGEERLHRGVDLSVPIGTTVRAAAAGTVRVARESKVNGRMVVVDHGDGMRTSYLHNDELLVKRGDRVARGDAIALSGNTGRTTGPHLHYQVELAGEVVDPLALRRPRLLRADAEASQLATGPDAAGPSRDGLP